jgi:hypothetical protein
MRNFAMVLLGVLLGVLAFGGVRYMAAPPLEHAEPIHYHANFHLFLEGERVRFQEQRYMEDLATCRVDASLLSPADRVHLHQMIDDVVHVHAPGVTWGHFLTVLGYAVGEGVIVDDDGGIHAGSGGNQLTFVVNGQRASSLANLEVRSLDRVLIYHGPESTDPDSLDALHARVPDNADDYNASHQDGVGCTAGAHDEEEGRLDRLRRAFWF